MKKTVIVQQTPAMILQDALSGDREAQRTLSRGSLANARILFPKDSGEGFKSGLSLEALGVYMTHSQELPRTRGKTPAQAWASKTHCAVDGTILLSGRSIELDLDYSEASRDLMVTIRVLVASGVLGGDNDSMADRVEEILAAGGFPGSKKQMHGRFWGRCKAHLSSATAADRASAEDWLDNGATRGPIGGLPARGGVTIGGSVINSTIVTGGVASGGSMAEAFADTFQDEPSALSILDRAGVRRSRMRQFSSMTPKQWWADVLRQGENGLFNTDALFAAARAAYPGSTRFGQSTTSAGAIWEDKLRHFNRELAMTTDAGQKFSIGRQINECLRMLGRD